MNYSLKSIFLYVFSITIIVFLLTYLIVGCGQEKDCNNCGWTGSRVPNGAKISTESTGWTIHVQITDAGVDCTLP